MNYGWRTQLFIALVAVVGVVAVTAFSFGRKSGAATGAAASAQPAANEPPLVTDPKMQDEERAPPVRAPRIEARDPSAEPTFDKAAAVEGLVSAVDKAKGCRKANGPTGMGKVVVTFAKSGRVIQANVFDPPFAGTSVGGCVAALFRAITVPAFVGDPVTVTRRFSIE